MSKIIIPANGLKTYEKIDLPDGHCIVSAWPNTVGGTYEEGWPDIYTANHNIFRLTANNEVVWQVVRDERWSGATEEHVAQRQKDLQQEWRPFVRMDGLFEYKNNLTEPSSRYYFPEQRRVFFKEYAAGRMICVLSQRDSEKDVYTLDPATGIATRTGEWERQ